MNTPNEVDTFKPIHCFSHKKLSIPRNKSPRRSIPRRSLKKSQSQLHNQILPKKFRL